MIATKRLETRKPIVESPLWNLLHLRQKVFLLFLEELLLLGWVEAGLAFALLKIFIEVNSIPLKVLDVVDAAILLEIIVIVRQNTI